MSMINNLENLLRSNYTYPNHILITDSSNSLEEIEYNFFILDPEGIIKLLKITDPKLRENPDLYYDMILIYR